MFCGFGGVVVPELLICPLFALDPVGNDKGFVAAWSEPIGANGFNLPSSPIDRDGSGMLESRKPIKAGSEKIASFNFMLLALSKTERRFLVIEAFWSKLPVFDVVVLEEVLVLEETRFCWSGAFLMNKTYTKIKTAATTVNIIMFFLIN